MTEHLTTQHLTTQHTANFVLRVKETKHTLHLSVHNLKTGQSKKFSSWKALLGWLESQVKQEGLR
jgi:hypothetical protein